MYILIKSKCIYPWKVFLWKRSYVGYSILKARTKPQNWGKKSQECSRLTVITLLQIELLSDDFFLISEKAFNYF